MNPYISAPKNLLYFSLFIPFILESIALPKDSAFSFGLSILNICFRFQLFCFQHNVFTSTI